MGGEICLETSVIVAVGFGEATVPEIRKAIDAADALCVGAATVFEAILVIGRRLGGDAEDAVFELLAAWGATIVPLDERQIRLANEAFQRFGKGRHPAALNFGDCLSYAAAKSRGARLLYVGEDFARTDLA